MRRSIHKREGQLCEQIGLMFPGLLAFCGRQLGHYLFSSGIELENIEMFKVEGMDWFPSSLIQRLLMPPAYPGVFRRDDVEMAREELACLLFLSLEAVVFGSVFRDALNDLLAVGEAGDSVFDLCLLLAHIVSQMEVQILSDH